MRKKKCSLKPTILSFLSTARFLKFAGAERTSRATWGEEESLAGEETKFEVTSSNCLGKAVFQ